MRILMAGTGSGGQQNFEHTVRSPVDLEQYAHFLTPAQRKLLTATHGRYARVWGFIPAKKGPSVSAASELAPGHQAWFHYAGYVHTTATVATVFNNLAFDNALWDDKYPATGFVFTLTEPRTVTISKSRINEFLGYKANYHWANNRLLDEEQSKLLARDISTLK